MVIHLHSEPRNLNGDAKGVKEKSTEEYIVYTAKVKYSCRKKARHSFSYRGPPGDHRIRNSARAELYHSGVSACGPIAHENLSIS